MLLGKNTSDCKRGYRLLVSCEAHPFQTVRLVSTDYDRILNTADSVEIYGKLDCDGTAVCGTNLSGYSSGVEPFSTAS